MARVVVAYFLLLFLSNSCLESVDAQSTKGKTSWDIITEVGTLTTAVEGLQAKIDGQVTLLRNLTSKEEMSTNALNNFEEKLSALENLLSNIETKMDAQANSLSTLEAESKTQNGLLNNLQTTTVAMQANLLSLFEEKFSSLANLVNNVMAEDQKQVTSLNNLEIKTDAQALLLNNLHNSSLNNLQVTTAAMQANLFSLFEEKFSLLANLVNKGITEDQKQETSLNSLHFKVTTHADFLTSLNASVSLQATSLSNLQAESNLQNNLLNKLVTTLTTQANEFNNFNTKIDTQTSILTNVQARSNLQTALLGKMNSNQELQATSLSDLEAASKTHKNLLHGLQNTTVRHSTVLNNLQTKADRQATSINNLVAEVEWHEPVAHFKTSRTIVAIVGDDVEMWCVVRGTPLPEIKWTRENGTLSYRVVVENNGKVLRIKNFQLSDEGTYVCVAANGVGNPVSQAVRLQVYYDVDGIVAGTDSGAFVIPFSSMKSKPVPSGLPVERIYGLTFDWNSEKIYFLKRYVGIIRSNLDGSESKILLSDSSSELRGLTIEPTTGNVIYGNRTSGTIRVCNNDVTKCSTIVNGSDLSSVWDFAVHRSKGLLFWSIWGGKIVRANLDGSNAAVILQRNSVRGIDVDEQEDRLYWTSQDGVGSCDMSGQRIRELPTVAGNIYDVAIEKDNVYYGNWDTNAVHATSKLGMNSSMFAQLTSDVNHIALFGTRASNNPPNPCDEANCAHLCVLVTRWSYRCTCPDAQVLNTDGKTCTI